MLTFGSMSLPTAATLSAYTALPIFVQIDRLREQTAAYRPFNQELQQRILNKLRLNWNYHSNAIEGNRLNYGETIALLMHGVTAKGKPLKDHLDITGHDQAIQQMLDLVGGTRPLTQTDIRELHKIVLQHPYTSAARTPDGQPVQKQITVGAYKTQPNHVRTITGQIHYYTAPESVAAEMTDLVSWVNTELEAATLPPTLIATVFHHAFVAIHPFDDGNGRLGRILMNFVLLRAQLPPAVIQMANRETYYGALAQADAGDYTALIELIGASVARSLQLQLDVLRGERLHDYRNMEEE